ncbi:MAG: hypothetical protein AAF799_03195 [Myxococcota bacterium]
MGLGAFTLVLASGRALADGIAMMLLVAGLGSIVALISVGWTLRLLLRKAEHRASTDARRLKILGRVHGGSALACIVAWAALGGETSGDVTTLLPAAAVFGVLGAVALRRAATAGD